MNIIRFIKSVRIYSNTVLTYEFVQLTNILCSADIIIVNSDNYKDAMVYEPKDKVEQFKKFLDDGDRGYYAYLNGQWAHRSWVTFGPKQVHQWHNFAPMMIHENEAYIHWCATAPVARSKNIYAAVLSRIASDLMYNYNKIYISTTSDNIASQKAIEKAGYCKIERLKIISFMSITFKIICKGD